MMNEAPPRRLRHRDGENHINGVGAVALLENNGDRNNLNERRDRDLNITGGASTARNGNHANVGSSFSTTGGNSPAPKKVIRLYWDHLVIPRRFQAFKLMPCENQADLQECVVSRLVELGYNANNSDDLIINTTRTRASRAFGALDVSLE